MWIATIDFIEAFDSISHISIWNAVEQCGIESYNISLLKRLYVEQKATVPTDKESDMFEIKRRTKQGDPLSSLPFQHCTAGGLERRPSTLAKGKKAWALDCLTNLRLADDVLLFATSMEQLHKMMRDFKQSTEKVGLKIHPEEMKILSNGSSSRRREMVIDNIKVDMLTKEESTKVLGRMVTFQQTGDN